MLLRKMEIISRVELFERFITFLEMTCMHGSARRYAEFDTSVIYHVLLFIYFVFACFHCMV